MNKKYLQRIQPKPRQYYEILLFKQGELVEKVDTPKYATFKGEFERIEKIANSSPLYEMVANLKDSDHQFEKRIY